MMFADITNSDLGAFVMALATIIQVASAIVAILTMRSSQKREISFLGTPVDKADFDVHCEAQKTADFKVWEKMEKDRIECAENFSTIKATVAGLTSASEESRQRIVTFDNKLDRILKDLYITRQN